MSIHRGTVERTASPRRRRRLAAPRSGVPTSALLDDACSTDNNRLGSAGQRVRRPAAGAAGVPPVLAGPGWRADAHGSERQ